MTKSTQKWVDLLFLLLPTEKSLTRSMPTKMQNQKKEGFSY